MSNELTSLFTRIGIFAVLIAIFFWLYQDPQRDETGAIVQGGNIDPLELFAGDCYKEDFVVLEGDETVEQFSVEALPCSNPHNNEIFSAFQSLTPYEPDQDIFFQMSEVCYEELADYIGFSENVSNDDLERFDAEYALNITFTYDTRAGNESDPDPRKPFSCVINNKEKFTNFSGKDYLAL